MRVRAIGKLILAQSGVIPLAPPARAGVSGAKNLITGSETLRGVYTECSERAQGDNMAE